ncbi:MAG: response regulator [Pseudomonadota bacterium]
MKTAKKGNKENYLSTRKAADLLDVSLRTIQLWTDSGLLQAWTTHGGHRRITLDSVEELLAQRKFPEKKPAKNKQLTIVIVEDDISQLKLYKNQFYSRELDLNIIEASNGYEGLIHIGRYQPSIIITDLMMPGMDGFQMLKALMNTPELTNCLIIVISALTKEEVEELGSLPEQVLFFNKPIPFDELENVILKKKLKELIK